jgi:hypothetical protein
MMHSVSVVLAASLTACAEPAELPPPARPSVQVVAIDLDDGVGVSKLPPARRAPPEFEDTDPDGVRLFYDVLAAYGTWRDDARLGLVWTPAEGSVGEGFVPYATHGRWTHRRFPASIPVDEYVWTSDLPWGWVTFHYGRWAYAGDRGWSWIPGRKYAGAWVDWRTPEGGEAAVVGWGPTPPTHIWRVSVRRLTRTRALGVPFDPNNAHLVTVPFAAFATPYTYCRATDLFAHDLGHRLLPGGAALAVASTTHPSGPPTPEQLGLDTATVPQPPTMDRGLQQAFLLATPASAIAIGRGPELGSPPRLRTWVTGGPRWAALR